MKTFLAVGLLSAACALGGAFAAPVPADKKSDIPPHYANRFGGNRVKAAKDDGATAESEAAVWAGLVWLAKQQKADGSWVLDGSSSQDKIAGTGLGLLPFLGAGQAQAPRRATSILDGGAKLPEGAKILIDGKYQKAVAAGLAYLIANQQKDGSFKGCSGMYSHGIATLALCEAHATAGDPKYREPAQKAVDFIVAVQGKDGSWGYPLSRSEGDTSIVGWQAQALYAASLCPDLKVPADAKKNVSAFLDTVCDGKTKGTYGYRDRNNIRPSLTAIGLLTRAELDGWQAKHDGMTAGTAYLTKNWLPRKERFDMYYYYYATQVFHGVGGEDWEKKWNPAMRDLLVGLQIPDGKATSGSWDADTGMVGSHCGRLGTTSLALLTLEVYYRYTPFTPKKAD